MVATACMMHLSRTLHIQHKPCIGCFCFSVGNRLRTAPYGMLLAGCRQTSYWLSMRSLAASMIRRRPGTPCLRKAPPRSDPSPFSSPPDHCTQGACLVAPSHITAALSCFAAALMFKSLYCPFGHMLADLLSSSLNHLG